MTKGGKEFESTLEAEADFASDYTNIEALGN
jgi:hypothetical protein